jgi:hypothetical protein
MAITVVRVSGGEPTLVAGHLLPGHVPGIAYQ